MLDDALHNLCVQDMEEGHLMVLVEEDQVMVLVEEDQVMVLVVTTEIHLQETNTKKEEPHDQHMEDKVVIVERNGNLTLKDKDYFHFFY